MAAGGRFGGHIVQGHVDGTGEIRSVKRDQNAVVFEITPDRESLFKYIIPKGSITLDGISLTVVGTSSSAFTVSIIPHTLGKRCLPISGLVTASILNVMCWANMSIISCTTGERIIRKKRAAPGSAMIFWRPTGLYNKQKRLRRPEQDSVRFCEKDKISQI